MPSEPSTLVSFPCPCGGTFSVRVAPRPAQGGETSVRCDGPRHDDFMRNLRRLAETAGEPDPTAKSVEPLGGAAGAVDRPRT
jgi:hypothetical protein